MIKILEKDHLFLLFFGLFGALGLINSPTVSAVLGFSVLIIGAIDIIYNENKSGEAHLYICIIGVLELLLRMNKSLALDQIAKYAIIIFAGMGLFYTRKRRQSNALGLLFILLYLPSLMVIDTSFEMWTRGIFFNILGPIGLGMLLMYFFQYQMNSIDIRNIIRAVVLPISSVLVFLQTNSLSLNEIEDIDFTASQTSLSGNFGGNQVSVLMGVVAGLLLYAVFFGIKIFKFRIIEYGLLGYCIIRGLLTFSRGGITAPFVAFAIITLVSFIRIRNLQAFKKGIYLFVGAVLFYLFFLLVNSLTGDSLERRYAGETGSTEKTGERDYLSGRDQIMFIDLEIFADNFLIGVGPGMARPLRYYYGFSDSVAAHVEFSRVLAEHGLLGLFSLIIYVIIMFSRKKRWVSFSNETFFLAFVWWIGFINSNHNAFRLGITVFFLGIVVSKINVNPKYFTKGARKHYKKEWEEWLTLQQKTNDAAPKIAESAPGKKLETNFTFPR